ncbi:MAG: hypothetical protein LBL91_03850 [Lachnospiraceae bacterium]|jgi:hypothetical protein|nr:hypothetical protein [Lachnospiraceae bacterium]
MKKSICSVLSTVIFVIVVLSIVVCTGFLYILLDYDGFQKGQAHIGKTLFLRDIMEDYSYKLESKDYNDAMFYKTINVEKNTAYRVSCMVKTDNVLCKNTNEFGGAGIYISNNLSICETVQGTNDWQKMEVIFNSKNNEQLDIGFRLGGNYNLCTGTAWFNDFKLEKGEKIEDTEWEVACFIFKNIDVNIEEEQVINLKLSMSNSDIETVKDNMRRFETSINELSNKQISINYRIIEIDEPITNISYSDEHGYYISPHDIDKQVSKYVQDMELDHVFAVIRLGNSNIQIPTYDWIGLGGFEYYGMGFSNIRLSNNENNYTYRYSRGINTFPEEVYIHEFLHSLEREMVEAGYDIPPLHDNLEYGYEFQSVIGLKNWYKAYMTKTILDKETNTYIGLYPEVYKMKNAAEKYLRNAVQINY